MEYTVALMSHRNMLLLRLLVIGGVLLALAAVAGWRSSQSDPMQTEGLRAGERWSGNALKIPFRWCPRGTFTMGSPAKVGFPFNYEEQVSITLSRGFWLGETEVTQWQWQSVMGTTPWKGREYTNLGSNYPATYVSHSDRDDSAEEFCRRFTAREQAAGRLPEGWVYRLPTEAEWEYGCRAGTTTAYSFGDDSSKLDDYAWTLNNCRYELSSEWWLASHDLYAHPVGLKRANPWGLRDMHGNVWEWCRDPFSWRLPGGMDPDSVDAWFRVGRGGSWGAATIWCRSSSRHWEMPDYQSGRVGFRIVRCNR